MSCKLTKCCGSKYKLIYFDGKGRAETIRLVLAAAGVNYEDKRLSKDEWPSFKPNTPWGSLPVLEVDGKIMLGESLAIARFVARESGLIGKNSLEQALVDSVVDVVTELREKGLAMMFAKEDTDKEKLKLKFVEETLATTLEKLDKFLGGKNYFVGDKLTLADLHFYGVLEAIAGITPGDLKGHPKLDELYQRVASNPKVAEYIKKRPVTPF